MLIVRSPSLDVYRNLALEEYLMEQAGEHDAVLFLWRSAGAVVLGKNQNPWRECHLDRMRADGIPLARRISGGGAVYHDAGNLNYCVIVNRIQYREAQAYAMVLDALKHFDLQVERTGTSNLSIGGLKFSGNAFSFRKGRALHHGTLLLHTDLTRLQRYLGTMVDQIETHAIRSVPARVTNLSLDIAAVSDGLIESFKREYGGGELTYWEEDGLDKKRLKALQDKQASWLWRFGATPRFSVQKNAVRFEVAGGKVVGVAGADPKEFLGKAFESHYLV